MNLSPIAFGEAPQAWDAADSLLLPEKKIPDPLFSICRVFRFSSDMLRGLGGLPTGRRVFRRSSASCDPTRVDNGSISSPVVVDEPFRGQLRLAGLDRDMRRTSAWQTQVRQQAQEQVIEPTPASRATFRSQPTRCRMAVPSHSPRCTGRCRPAKNVCGSDRGRCAAAHQVVQDLCPLREASFPKKMRRWSHLSTYGANKKDRSTLAFLI
jgi:hypothetical protein